MVMMILNDDDCGGGDDDNSSNGVVDGDPPLSGREMAKEGSVMINDA